MSKKINEYTKKPNHNTMTPEEQHQWYLIATRDLSWFKSTGDATELEQAIIDYEQRHGVEQILIDFIEQDKANIK